MIQNPLVLANRILDELVALSARLQSRLTPGSQAEAEREPAVPLALQVALARLQAGAPLTTGEVLCVLGCSERALARLVKRSAHLQAAVPRWKLGDRWRWNGDVLVEWATSLSEDAPKMVSEATGTGGEG